MVNVFHKFPTTQKGSVGGKLIIIRRLVNIVTYFFSAFLVTELLFMASSRYILRGQSMVSKEIETLHLTIKAPESSPNRVRQHNFTGHIKKETHDGQVEFVLYRSIGNDLPPRHAPGQSYRNIKFILKNEPDHPGLEKRWILNHIFNTTEKKRIIRLLDAHKQHYEILNLNFSMVDSIPLHHEGFSEHDVMRRNCRRYGTVLQKAMYRVTLIDHLYREKNLYVINNNGARNRALESGIRDGFKWILPWDGNCFLTKSAWNEMRETVKAHSAHKYFHVPMVRLMDNKLVLDPAFNPTAVEEPQLIFRNDAKERFSATQRYGRRPKVDLLLRLGIPGAWDEYVKASRPYFEAPIKYTVSSDVAGEVGEEGEFKGVGVPRSGWVARLYSGSGNQEVSTKDSADLRKLARCYGVNTLLDLVDTHTSKKLHYLSKETLGIYNETVMEKEREAYEHDPSANKDLVELIQKLEACAKQSLTFPTDNMDKLLGSPIAVSSKVYDKPEEIIPAARLGPFFRNTTCLALGWFYTRRNEFANAAAMLLSSFFLDEDTRVSPQAVVNSMFYVEEKKNDEDKTELNLSVVGSIEMKDLYYFLDAVRLVARSGILTVEELNMIRLWFSEYSELVLRRAQGDIIGFQGGKDGFEYRAFGPRGVYYDLQLASVGAFSGNSSLFMFYAKHAKGRMQHQFALKSQPRPYSHNAYIGTMRFDLRINLVKDPAFIIKQLNAWFLLARISKLGGIDLVSFQHADASQSIMRTATLFNVPWFESQYWSEMTLKKDLKKTANTTRVEIQSKMTQEMEEGILLSYYLALRAWPDLIGKQDSDKSFPGLYKASPLPNEKLGLHPFWNLGLTDQYLASVNR